MTKITETIETIEQAKMLKKDLPLHIKGIDLIAENPLDTLISNNTGWVMGYTWILDTDIMKVYIPPIIIRKNKDESFTSGTK